MTQEASTLSPSNSLQSWVSTQFYGSVSPTTLPAQCLAQRWAHGSLFLSSHFVCVRAPGPGPHAALPRLLLGPPWGAVCTFSRQHPWPHAIRALSPPFSACLRDLTWTPRECAVRALPALQSPAH